MFSVPCRFFIVCLYSSKSVCSISQRLIPCSSLTLSLCIGPFIVLSFGPYLFSPLLEVFCFVALIICCFVPSWVYYLLNIFFPNLCCLCLSVVMIAIFTLPMTKLSKCHLNWWLLVYLKPKIKTCSVNFSLKQIKKKTSWTLEHCRKAWKRVYIWNQNRHC